MKENDIFPQPRPLHGMFEALPPRYDRINNLVTWGMDRRWRKLTARVCLEGDPRRILDLGCGTGDLSVHLARLAPKGVAITGLDYSQPMLELAKRKAYRAGVFERIKFINGDAASLPFPDGHFDCVGISFAFRNLTFRSQLRRPHLAEVKRVLRPGGRYVIVDSSQPGNPVVRWLFHRYMYWVAKPVGTLLSGNPAAYRYLAESMSLFYGPGEVTDMLLKAGFRKVSYRPLWLGIIGLHVATK